MKIIFTLILLLGAFSLWAQNVEKKDKAPAVLTTEKPLYVLDGVRLDGKGEQLVNKMDPAGIASIRVLKGDSATLAYGESGKYGVVIITTKNKKEKKSE